MSSTINIQQELTAVTYVSLVNVSDFVVVIVDIILERETDRILSCWTITNTLGKTLTESHKDTVDEITVFNPHNSLRSQMNFEMP